MSPKEFTELLDEKNKENVQAKSNLVVTNLRNLVLTNEQHSIIQFGLRIHCKT